MATAHSVANEFIRLAAAEGKQLTPLQLMKLVYISHGWMLGLYQRPLFLTRVEAWKYGPVIPDLYHMTKKFGSGPVTGELRPSVFWPSDAPLDKQEKDIIAQVYTVYGGMNGIQLSALTHRTDTPWGKTWTPDATNTLIPDDLIAEHYRQLARERPSSGR